MEESRTKKTARNMFFMTGYKLSDAVLAFVLRYIFIQTLGVTYLGIRGLFTNILAVLSMMELGVGSAIAFSLYRPLAEKDNQKVIALMQLYKKVYTSIGFLVCIVGTGIVPFLKYIINMPTQVEGLYCIYILSVLNTAVTYFLAYRRTLLIADQRSDICTRIDIIFRFIRCFGLICIMVFTHNYIVYLLFELINSIFNNVVINVIVKYKYKYINTKTKCNLEQREKKKIVKYVSSGIFAKFGQTMVTSTDSIIISTFIGTEIVGLYSNYNMIYANLEALIYMIFSNITPAVGNYAVLNDRGKLYNLFKNISFLNYIVVCTISVCFYCLASPFIMLWVGSDYLLSNTTVMLIALNFYITANLNGVTNFMSANGEMYYRNRYRALIEGIINIISSVFLVKYTNLGLAGVFLGTTICFLFGRMWMDARILYKYWFQVSFVEYIKCYTARLLCAVILSAILKPIVSLIFGKIGLSIISWILCALVCIGVCVGTFFCLWRKTSEYTYIISRGRRIMKRILK